MVELQFTQFNASDEGDSFTFIPYGLESKVSKEAVKVHVLHGRKQNRVGRALQPQAPGQIIRWDSRANDKSRPKSAPQQRKGNRGGNHARDDTHVAAGPVRGKRHNPCCLDLHYYDDQGFSLSHLPLSNPLTDGMKDAMGVVSPLRVKSVNFLVDHYLNRCGTSKFPRELLSFYWQDVASFKAFLAHAATLFSLETGLLPPVNVEELMCDALREIRGRLTHQHERQADGTVLAVAILANVEEGRAQHDTAAWHWRGLKQLLNLRGDFSSLRLHRDLHAMLLWREILASNSSDFCLGHGIHDAPILLHCNHSLVNFFENFADELSRQGGKKPFDIKTQQFLTEVMNCDIARNCEWTSSMYRRSTIACLVYLASLAVSAGVTNESQKVMNRIRYQVIERSKSGPVGRDELLLVILRQADTEKEWRCQQLWQLSRCVFLTRTLGFTDWKTIRDILSLYLGIEHGCDNMVDVLSDWKKLSARLLLEDKCGIDHAFEWEGFPSV